MSDKEEHLSYEGARIFSEEIKTRLKAVTEMPETASNDIIRLYIGEDTDNYKKGHIYQFQTTENIWVDITPAVGITQQTTAKENVYFGKLEETGCCQDNLKAVFKYNGEDFYAIGENIYGIYLSLDGKEFTRPREEGAFSYTQSNYRSYCKYKNSVLLVNEYGTITLHNSDGNETSNSISGANLLVSNDEKVFVSTNNEIYQININNEENGFEIGNSVQVQGDRIVDLFIFGENLYAVTLDVGTNNISLHIFDFDLNEKTSYVIGETENMYECFENRKAITDNKLYIIKNNTIFSSTDGDSFEEVVDLNFNKTLLFSLGNSVYVVNQNECVYLLEDNQLKIQCILENKFSMIKRIIKNDNFVYFVYEDKTVYIAPLIKEKNNYLTEEEVKKNITKIGKSTSKIGNITPFMTGYNEIDINGGFCEAGDVLFVATGANRSLMTTKDGVNYRQITRDIDYNLVPFTNQVIKYVGVNDTLNSFYVAVGTNVYIYNLEQIINNYPLFPSEYTLKDIGRAIEHIFSAFGKTYISAYNIYDTEDNESWSNKTWKDNNGREINTIKSHCFFNNKLYIGTGYGIYRVNSDDNIEILFTAANISNLTVFRNKIYALGSNNCYVSDENGENFESINDLYVSSSDNNLMAFNDKLYSKNICSEDGVNFPYGNMESFKSSVNTVGNYYPVFGFKESLIVYCSYTDPKGHYVINYKNSEFVDELIKYIKSELKLPVSEIKKLF